MGLFDDVFGGSNAVDNSAEFERFGQQMRDRMGVYNPWIDAAGRARDLTEGEYGKLISNPNFLQDMISKGYQESPYQKYLTDMTTKRMNMNAANTGMLYSGPAARALQQELTGMTGQFLNDYIQRGMGSYAQGLSGAEGLRNMGLPALGAQDALLEQGASAQLQGGLSKNYADASSNRGMFGNLMGIGMGMFGGGGGMPGMGSLPFLGNLTGSGGGQMTGAYNLPDVNNFNTGNFSY